MKIVILSAPIALQELKELAKANYGNMIKAVVDIRNDTLALGGELHADAEARLLQQGAAQEDLWGFNIYPDKPRDEWLEFTSFINIRPSQNNRSMQIQDDAVRRRIEAIVKKFIKNG